MCCGRHVQVPTVKESGTRSCRAARPPRAGRALRELRRAGTPGRSPGAPGRRRRGRRRPGSRRACPSSTPGSSTASTRRDGVRRAGSAPWSLRRRRCGPRPRRIERPSPGRLADVVDDEVDAAPVTSLTARDDVVRLVVDGRVGAELERALRASRRSRRSRSTRAPSAFAIECAALATPPPMPQISTHSPASAAPA